MNMMGASSTVSNILYSYFNIKRSKLIWTGSLETLKVFVLTEIDEETAETTTWRSPSGGKWLFDSKLLSVTWLTKSQNIYFDGEKGSDVMERIHSFLKQDPDNASEIANPAELHLERLIESLLADDSDDVTDDTFEESFSDQCDIAKELKNQEEKQAKNVVNDLKEDKLVLIRKNDELREQNMDMSHIISDLKMANKNLESEKSSLLTALKLIQNDHQQTCTKTIVENDGENNREVKSVNQNLHLISPQTISILTPKASTGKNRKKKGKKSKSKPPTQNSSQQTADVDTSGGIVNTSSSKSTGQGKKTVVITGDSIVKNTIGPKMSADDPNHHFIVKPFPGATVSNMEDFVKPLTRRTPDKMILHVGTNDLRSPSTPKIIADSIVNIVTQIKEDSPEYLNCHISGNTFELKSTTSSMVCSLLDKLCKSKATGLDKISAKLLRYCPDLLSESLTVIFNCSINTGIFPDEWKCSKVIPLFKHGERRDLNNYRPISIIPVVAVLQANLANES
ncbi:Hypothetical predicted protein [Paramuricea clavata]|uniref:Uncharacterized protein n=1 Tax=Paramuricea clavata TaxID=317549 RepID=A0A7D9E8J0_PARCT|nr:Hypothetical predicted protein [Paramuricea clavata]